MADVDKDPYALSSDSSDTDSGDEMHRRPPPKIAIEGRSNTDFQRIKQSLTAEKGEPIRDEKTLAEIAELKRLKAEELTRFKKEFETGAVKRDSDSDEDDAMPGAEKPTGLDKQTLSAFKDKFEKMDTTLGMNLEDRIRSAEKSLEGVGKENLVHMKNMFEKQPNKQFVKGAEANNADDELLSLLQHRSDAEKRRLRAAFDPTAAGATEESTDEPKNCCICEKIVYPVEKIIASRRLYHNTCFKCATCGKKLSPTTFNSHNGVLYCRPHMLDVLHPERMGAGGAEGDEEDEPMHVDEDEDDEFAVSSKPKAHAANVVQAGQSNIGDELSALRSQLQNKKQHWQQSVNEAATAASQRSGQLSTLADDIAAGRVKANLDKFISGAASEQHEDEENEENEEKRKQLDAIRSQVSEVKNKWKTGDVEKAETYADTAKDDELEALKRSVRVKERFSERNASADANEDATVVKSYDRSELDTSNASEARKSFLEGLAYQSGPIEKTSANELQDLKFEGLRSFKDKFEKGESTPEAKEKSMLELDVQLKAIKRSLERGVENLADLSPEARADRKKQEIEAEFLRYKLARKLQAKRQAEQAATEENTEIAQLSEEKGGVHVDIKMAGKAREKFKNIDAQNPGSVPMPKSKLDSQPSKWDKKTETTAEIVNKRNVDEVESSDEDDNFDVKNLMNKFKNIENLAPNKVEKRLDELEALRVEAKNLRQRFEQTAGGESEDNEQGDEKKRQLEEEFRHLKEERERAQKQLEEERQAAVEEEEAEKDAQKDDVKIAEAHASKMAAKWEKIQKKEAKKAQKSQMPQKANATGDV